MRKSIKTSIIGGASLPRLQWTHLCLDSYIVAPVSGKSMVTGGDFKSLGSLSALDRFYEPHASGGRGNQSAQAKERGRAAAVTARETRKKKRPVMPVLVASMVSAKHMTNQIRHPRRSRESKRETRASMIYTGRSLFESMSPSSPPFLSSLSRLLGSHTPYIDRETQPT